LISLLPMPFPKSWTPSWSTRSLAETSAEQPPRGRTTISVLAGTFQGRIPCPHSQCHGGGFEIERIVDQMVKARQETREGVLVCPGWIGDSDRVPCVNSVSYTVVLFFRPRTRPEKPQR